MLTACGIKFGALLGLPVVVECQDRRGQVQTTTASAIGLLIRAFGVEGRMLMSSSKKAPESSKFMGPEQ